MLMENIQKCIFFLIFHLAHFFVHECMCTLIFFVYYLNLFIFFFHFLSHNYFNHGFIDLHYIVQGVLIQILSETKKKL